MLGGMLGDDCCGIDATALYYDYVKVWMRRQDRGSLKHVSNDTFNCFKVLEVVTYPLIKRGCEKQQVMLEAQFNADSK